MKRVIWTAAALVAAVVVLIAVALPPRRMAASSDQAPETSAGQIAGGTVPGAVHIHTSRSDGRSTPEEIARFAARAGLSFVIFTDHGDATREPDPPTYRSGVLCIDAVEISTDQGHLIALGLPAAPYPLAGDARDVLDDVHRLGGTGFAAHPDSPKGELQWRAWSAPIDGVELVNLDTAWRVHAMRPGWSSKLRLLTALATYPVRPAETIASLIGNHEELMVRWDALGARARVPMLAGVDAHARLALRGQEYDRDDRFTLALPGYEAVFRTLSMHVSVERPLTGDAATDAGLVIDALRRGHAFASVDAFFGPPVFHFAVRVGDVAAAAGDEIAADGPVTVTVRTNAPASFTTTVWRNGKVLSSQPASAAMSVEAPAGPAVFRADVRATDRPGAPPWVLSNAIYVREATAAPASVPATGERPRDGTASLPSPLVLFDDRTAVEWHTEVGSASKAALDLVNAARGREMQVRYGLPGGEGVDQFAAAVADVTSKLEGRSRLRFTIRAGQPMRVSVQLRVPRASGEERWRRSVYVSDADRTYTLPFSEFAPAVGSTVEGPLEVAAVHAVLFTVDRVNTGPSGSGRFWLQNVVVE